MGCGDVGDPPKRSRPCWKLPSWRSRPTSGGDYLAGKQLGGERGSDGGGGEDLRLVSWAVNPSCNWDFSLPNYPRGSGTQWLPARACGTGDGLCGAGMLFDFSLLFFGIKVIYFSLKDTRYPAQEDKKLSPLFPFLSGPFTAFISSSTGTKIPAAGVSLVCSLSFSPKWHSLSMSRDCL